MKILQFRHGIEFLAPLRSYTPKMRIFRKTTMPPFEFKMVAEYLVHTSEGGRIDVSKSVENVPIFMHV